MLHFEQSILYVLPLLCVINTMVIKDKQKKAEAEQKQQQKEPLKASDIYSDSDEESSSAEETPPSNNVASEDEAGEKTIQDLIIAAPKHITTLDEINKIKLSRFRLEK